MIALAHCFLFDAICGRFFKLGILKNQCLPIAKYVQSTWAVR